MKYAKLSLGALAVGSLLGAGTLLALNRDATAGAKQTATVTINTSTRLAGGSIGSARNSASTLEYIGCSTTAFNGGDTMVMCTAKMAGSSPPTASCSIHNAPGFIDAVNSINGDSYVTFEWDANGVCTKIAVITDSTYEPKAP